MTTDMVVQELDPRSPVGKELRGSDYLIFLNIPIGTMVMSESPAAVNSFSYHLLGFAEDVANQESHDAKKDEANIWGVSGVGDRIRVVVAARQNMPRTENHAAGCHTDLSSVSHSGHRRIDVLPERSCKIAPQRTGELPAQPSINSFPHPRPVA